MMRSAFHAEWHIIDHVVFCFSSTRPFRSITCHFLLTQKHGQPMPAALGAAALQRIAATNVLIMVPVYPRWVKLEIAGSW